MSHPTDPTRSPSPEQPEANKPEQAKGDHQAGDASDAPMGRSSFEFQLPEGVDSFSEMPAVPPPDVNESGTHQNAIPPRPTTIRPANTFDFISTTGSSQGSAFDMGGEPTSLPPIDLPRPPSSSGEIAFELPGPNADPASLTLGAEMLNLPKPGEDVDSGLSTTSVPDIAGLFPDPTVPDVPDNNPGSFAMGELAIADLELPPVAPSATFPRLLDPNFQAADSSPLMYIDPHAEPGLLPLGNPSTVDLDLPIAEPIGDDAAATSGVTKSDPGLFLMGGLQSPATATPSTPELESVVGNQEPTDPVKPASGWLDQSGVAKSGGVPAEAKPVEEEPIVADLVEGELVDPSAGETPTINPKSSFDFDLPLSSEIPIPPHETADTGDLRDALPPPPETSEPVSKTFHFTEVPKGGLAAKFGITREPNPEDLPLLLPAEDASKAPSESSEHDPEGVLDNLELVDPIMPASGWLDSDIQQSPPAEPVVEEVETLPEEVIESSDIFSRSRANDAASVEHSDVIAATAFNSINPTDTEPAEPVRLSDIALTFDRPQGGSTIQDGGGSDLPIADEVVDSVPPIELLPGDAESIHDMPGMTAVDPLFDSSRLVDTPDLPGAPASLTDDVSSEYGRPPVHNADASSILADLSDPDLNDSNMATSSVRVESPGVDRTLTGGPAEGAFDLTVPDEPIPAGLFDEPSDGNSSESTDWHSRSGSDLFVEGRSSPEIDLEGVESAETIDPRLEGEDPSLASSPSSIFSGNRSRPGGSGVIDSDAHIDPRPASGGAEVEEVEFSDHPAFNDPDAQGSNLHQMTSASTDRHSQGASSADFELPDAETKPTAKALGDEGVDVDWDAVDAADGNPKDGSLSKLLQGLADDSSEAPTREKPASGTHDSGEPVVTVDWMSSSSEQSAVVDLEQKPTSKPKSKERKERTTGSEEKTKPSRAESSERTGTKPKREKEKSSEGKKSGMGVGLVAGMLLAGGAWAGLYFGNVIPNSEKVAQTPPPPGGTPVQPGISAIPGPNTPTTPTPASVPDATAAFATGDIGKALELVKTKQAATPDDKATAGRVRVYANMQNMGTAEDLKQGRADLQSVIDSADQTPAGVKRAIQATVDLAISYESAGDTQAARKLFTDAKAKYPTHAAVFDALLDRLDAPAGGGTSFRTPRLTPADAEKVLLSVGILLVDEPAATDTPEPGLYFWKAVKLASANKFAEAIDLMGKAKAAHVKRAKTLAGRGLNPLTDPLEQMFPRACDELAANWKLRSELYSNPAIADAVKKNGIAKTLDSLVQAEKDLTTAKANAAKLETDLKTAKETAETQKLEYQKGLTVANKKITDVTEERDALATQIKKQKDQIATQQDTLKQVAESLQPAVKLPEKWQDTDLVAGVRTVTSRATGPDLKALVPNAMTAIGGGGLSTGQLLDIADRLTKAEAATKVATEKLTAETKKLKDEQIVAIKKLNDENAEAIKKVKETNAEEVKKLTDRVALDTKKLNEAHAEAIKAEQAKIEAEKAKAALREITFQKQLANVVPPGQALDIWLPVLTDLRRPSDARPAMAIAKRALDSSLPDSDDAAKAHTVRGMAFLLQGEYSEARDEFQIARRSPAYKVDKPWARVADTGLEAVTDPLALYRQPVVIPAVDPKAAAQSLDTGIIAFKASKFDTAITALIDAAKYDPSDPVTWYFLGAARWSAGNTEQAKKDFAQGAEREKYSPMPSRTVSDALTPIQGHVRDAIDTVRP